jgi:RHS repeat-associated protein
VRYSSYGVPRSYPTGDYDLDGDVDAADTTALSNFIAGSGGWNLDFNRDGNVDGDDVTDHATYVSGYVGGSGGPGVQSRVSLLNRVGYAGYQWDHIVQGDHVRHRVYLPGYGRWTRRDPAGDDGDPASAYLYCDSGPVFTTDPSGLDPLLSMLILHYFNGNGSALDLSFTQYLSQYVSDPAISTTVLELKAEVEQTAHSYGAFLRDSLDCSCPPRPPRQKTDVFVLNLKSSIPHGWGTGPGVRIGFGSTEPPGPQPSLLVPYIKLPDWKWAVGGHHLYLTAKCYMYSACASLLSPENRFYMFGCQLQYRGRDTFRRPLKSIGITSEIPGIILPPGLWIRPGSPWPRPMTPAGSPFAIIFDWKDSISGFGTGAQTAPCPGTI